MEEVFQAPRVAAGRGNETMLAPQEVQRMLALQALGWGAKRISREVGCSRNTVREYLRQGGWRPMEVAARAGALEAHREWLADRLRRHRGNADVVRQDLARELGIQVSLRTVQRAVEPLRRELIAEAVATVRYETPPGQQLQIDFGSTAVLVGQEVQRIHLFVATLGYSRRCYVAVFLHERQSAWLQGLEGAFRHFGGVPQELLLDNARALVTEHNVQTREVKFNDRFHAFCRYWGVTPRACAPYRARTKGKDERGVGYVKRNAIAGHRFDSLEALHAHVVRWLRDVADTRVHGTTGEPPILRFEREVATLKPLQAKAPFLQVRELTRRVHTDACIELDTNRYSVPWRLIGESVTVVVAERQVRVLYAGREVACHAQSPLRRATAIDRCHLAGIVGASTVGVSWLPRMPPPPPATSLVTQLARAHAEGRLEDKLLHFTKPKLLIVDELGYLPFEANAAHLFFQLVSRRYERGSMLVTSNRSVAEWGGVFGDAVVATAILDRLLHHSHIVTIRGDSYRLRTKRRAGLVNQASANPAPTTN